MPLYDFDCDCGNAVRDRFVSIRDIDTHVETCGQCGKPMEQSLRGSYQHRPWVPYVDQNIASKPVLITSQAHRSRLLRQNSADYAPNRVGDPGCMV